MPEGNTTAAKVRVTGVLRDQKGVIQLVQTKNGHVFKAMDFAYLIDRGVIEAYTEEYERADRKFLPAKILAKHYKKDGFDGTTTFGLYLTTAADDSDVNNLDNLPGFEL